MNSVVCTLFEGHYHYGVAALVNSLYANGFRGVICAGYRGPLPAWTNSATDFIDASWTGAKKMSITDGLDLYLLPVETTYHLTNYKPTFALQLLNSNTYNANAIFYFDPDIVNKCDWTFYERWIGYGVAIVQDIAGNNLSPYHPKRARWTEVIIKSGRKTERLLYNYFNGGFFGLKKTDIDFLHSYENIIETGIANYDFDINHFSKKVIQTAVFPVGDQDAMNIAAMCCTANISDFGPEGMDFIDGGWLMSHAAGSPKPWKKKFFLAALKGQKISTAEKSYWLADNGLIKTHTASFIRFKRVSIKIASLLNRFYLRK